MPRAVSGGTCAPDYDALFQVEPYITDWRRGFGDHFLVGDDEGAEYSADNGELRTLD